jgi:hypothetical protein
MSLHFREDTLFHTAIIIEKVQTLGSYGSPKPGVKLEDIPWEQKYGNYVYRKYQTQSNARVVTSLSIPGFDYFIVRLLFGDRCKMVDGRIVLVPNENLPSCFTELSNDSKCKDLIVNGIKLEANDDNKMEIIFGHTYNQNYLQRTDKESWLLREQRVNNFVKMYKVNLGSENIVEFVENIQYGGEMIKEYISYYHDTILDLQLATLKQCLLSSRTTALYRGAGLVAILAKIVGTEIHKTCKFLLLMGENATIPSVSVVILADAISDPPLKAFEDGNKTRLVTFKDKNVVLFYQSIYVGKARVSFSRPFSGYIKQNGVDPAFSAMSWAQANSNRTGKKVEQLIVQEKKPANKDLSELDSLFNLSV